MTGWWAPNLKVFASNLNNSSVDENTYQFLVSQLLRLATSFCQITYLSSFFLFAFRVYLLANFPMQFLRLYVPSRHVRNNTHFFNRPDIWHQFIRNTPFLFNRRNSFNKVAKSSNTHYILPIPVAYNSRPNTSQYYILKIRGSTNFM